MQSENDLLVPETRAKEPCEAENSIFTLKPFLYFSVIMACFGNITFGFDVGSYGGVLDEVEDNLNLSTFQTELVIGQFYIGCALGGLFAGSIADHFGRRAALWVASALFIVGIALQVAAENVITLLIGRLVAGVGGGVSWAASGIYVAEIAPARLRGFLVVIVDMAINLGLVFGYVAALALYTVCSWRGVVAVGMLFPAIMMLALFFMPESPRWIMLQSRTPETRQLAKLNLDLLEATPEDASTRLQELSVLASEEDEDSNVPIGRMCSQLMANPTARGALFIGMFMGICQQWSGTEAILYYSSDMLEAAGISNTFTILWCDVAIASCKLLGEVVSQMLVDRTGRRPLLLLSGALTVLGFGAMTLSYGYSWPDESKPILLCVIMFFFSLGVGPLTLVCVCEISPTRYRATIVSASLFCNRVMSGTVAFTFLSMSVLLGSEARVFVIYTTLAVVSLVFYYATIPEMARVSLDSEATYLPPFYRWIINADSCSTGAAP